MGIWDKFRLYWGFPASYPWRDDAVVIIHPSIIRRNTFYQLSETKGFKTHIWRWPDCDCSRLDWSIQTQTLSRPPRSGTSQTSWPKLLGCRALEEEEEQTFRIKVSLFCLLLKLSLWWGVSICGRRIADEKTRRQKYTVQDFVLNFVVQGLEKGI